MGHKYLEKAVEGERKCAYGDLKNDNIAHGPIIATGKSLVNGGEFYICDLHLQIYKQAERDYDYDFKIKLCYNRDISSEAAVARRSIETIGLNDDLRTKLINSRKDLL